MAAEDDGAGGGAVALARIFVGGLAEVVSAKDLEGVFASAGRVAGVEFVRSSGRCFAYVDFHCPSDKALAKLFSTYNGCKWKGGKLKLEKAKEHYLVRLKREWEQEAAEAAAAVQEAPVKDTTVGKPEEKRKPEKDALDNSKINIYFPKLRKVRALPFKGSGKHKYSFRNIAVPSYPIHFCDCEEHCGPPEKANDEYASVLNAVAYEKERSIMNSVMSKLFEKDDEQFDSLEMHKHDVDVNITEPSDAGNDLQMEDTEAIPEENLDDLQMEEEEPCEEELDDDLVINIAPRKVKNSAVQLNRGKQAVNKDERFRKQQQFEETSPQKKRQKAKDLSKSRNRKHSNLIISEKIAGKSLPGVSGAIQNEQKTTGLSDSGRSSSGLQGVEALTGLSTKNGIAQDVTATEPKMGSLWTQKSAWRDLVGVGVGVGGMGTASFSLSQVLANTNPAPPKPQNATETPASRAVSRRKMKSSEKSSELSEAKPQPPSEQKLPSTDGTPSTATTVGSPGHETRDLDETSKVQAPRVIPKIAISETCPFMRSKESEHQWSKAKKVLTGFIKKGSENTGSNMAGKRKAPSRR